MVDPSSSLSASVSASRRRGRGGGGPPRDPNGGNPKFGYLVIGFMVLVLLLAALSRWV